MRTQHVAVDSLLLLSVAESGFPERKGDFRPLPRSLCTFCTYARILCAVAPLRNLMVSPYARPRAFSLVLRPHFFGLSVFDRTFVSSSVRTYVSFVPFSGANSMRKPSGGLVV